MLARSLGLLSAALTVALCALAPAMASAAEEGGEEVSVQFAVPASHGYEILVLGTGFAENEIERREGPGEAVLYVAKGRHRVALYRTTALVTETSVEADFGALGRIDLDLAKTGKKGKARAPGGICGRDVIPYEKTTYHGVFEFHGEEGFADASASRIPVSPQPWVDLICANHYQVKWERGPDALGASLSYKRKAGTGGRVGLEVTKSRPGGRTLVTAGTLEKRDGVTIARQVEVLVGAGSFRYKRFLDRATVRPPGPFAGSATFRRHAKPQNRFLGNLTVDLPGRADVPLAGPGLHPTLVPASWSVQGPVFR